MYATKMSARNRPATRSELTVQERGLVCRLIAADAESLRRIKADPRLGRVARRLLEAYREEMLEDLSRRIVAKGSSREPVEHLRLPEADRPDHLPLPVPA